MSKELDDAYFRSTPCTHHEPLLSKLVDCVNLLEERIKGLLGANVSVGETITLPAGSEATASASKRGYDTVLDFGIPKGDKGDPGEPGAPGAPGSDANVTKENVEAALGYEPLNAAYANNIYIMQKQIENLQGIAATEETDSTEAYTKTVPTGAQKWASLDKVGGKTVVWNQLQKLDINNKDNFPMWDTTNQTAVNGVVSAHIIGNFGGWNNAAADREELIVNNKYLFMVDVNIPENIKVMVKLGGQNNSYTQYSGTNSFQTMMVMHVASATSTKLIMVQSSGVSDYDIQIKNPFIFNLTQFFGAGNEPASLDDPRIAFIKAYAEEHPEYNQGELMSAEVVEVESRGKNLAIVDTFLIPAEVRDMCPGYGWSAGSVCNEIDFGRKMYVQRVGSVDLSTLNLSKGNASNIDEGYFGYYLKVSDNFPQMKPSANVVCKRFFYHPQTIIWEDMPADSFFSNAYLHFQAKYDTIQDFKAAMQGVLLYYELAEPVEVDLSDVLPDDHFIEVEASGTITFKQAETQLPVPSSVTYQISTKEAIANA